IGPQGSDDATTGDLNINAPMSIQGVGQSVTIIDGSGMTPTRDRVFTTGSNPDAAIPVSIFNVTIRGGQASFGGGINNDATLAIVDSTITGNVAMQSTPFAGGGISNSGGTGSLTLLRANVTNNTTYGNGGGIANGGTLTIESSTVSG